MKSDSLCAVTGRFQPFHCDHASLVEYALGLADRVIIGITNPDARSMQPIATSAHRHLSTANPFTFYERLTIITAALEDLGVATHRFEIVPFPLDAPEHCESYVPKDVPQLVRTYSDWEREKCRRLESAGYQVVALAGNEQSRISGTQIRQAMSNGSAWEHWVPAGTAAVIGKLHGNVRLNRG